MDYQDLRIWQLAIELSNEIYTLTRTFPKEQTYVLTAQLQRSAVSIASNIAEGEGRLTRGERRQALSQARGSLFELSTQLTIACNQGYTPEVAFRDRIAELRSRLDAYIAFVRNR